MSTTVRLLLAFAVCGAASTTAHAGSAVRYALVVGSNSGSGGPTDLPRLKHAESEARRLRDALVRYANFDHRRVELVTGGSREDVLAAARRLAERHRQDRESLPPDTATLFALFYTGHGLDGRLLTTDQPLTSADLTAIFKDVGADMNVGFFDACYSASLAGLAGKGALPTGFNPVRELPREILDAEGTVLLVSSRPQELSYEHERYGGLLTHFFLEAFTKAPADGVGVTLDRMWEFARARTMDVAAQHGVRQTPVKLVSHLKTEAPVYFSFRRDRHATLRFEPAVAGTFLLRYADTGLVETVSKDGGTPLDVPVYAGRVTIEQLRPGGKVAAQELAVAKGQSLRVGPMAAADGAEIPGYRRSRIRSKGQLVDVAVTERREALSVALGAGYALSPLSDGLLGAQHSARIMTWLAYGPWSVDIGIGYGWRGTEYPSWGYSLHQLSAGVRVGYGWEVGAGRLDLEVGADGIWMRVDYTQTGAQRDVPGALLAGAVRLTWPLVRDPEIRLHLRASVGGRLTSGTAAGSDDARWGVEPGLQVGLTFPIL